MIRDLADGPSAEATEAFRADITDEQACAAMAQHAVQAFGRIDVLVNNVGIGAGDGGPTSLEADVWDRIHDVNLKGMWLSCKHVLPHMKGGSRDRSSTSRRSPRCAQRRCSPTRRRRPG